MAFTLVGWSESQDSATLVNMAGLSDESVRVEGDYIVVPELNHIAGVYAIGAELTRAQLRSPSLRARNNFEVTPGQLSAEPADPIPFIDRFDSPIEVTRSEQLSFQAAEGGSGAQRSSGLVWLSDGAVQPVRGDIRTVRATSTTTCVAYAWTNGSITLSESLQAGRYQLVGLKAVSATGIGVRAVFVGARWRPGAVIGDAMSDIGVDRLRYGRAGSWGEFVHDEPPSMDWLCTGTDSSQQIDLDVLFIG